MTKHEFEGLAGYSVAFDDYEKIIEPMYMATDLSKQEFVKCVSKRRFALPTKESLIRKMRIIARHLKATCTNYCDINAEKELQALVEQYAELYSPTCCYVEKAEFWTCYYPKRLVTCSGIIDLA